MLEDLNRYFTNSSGFIRYRPTVDNGNPVRLVITAIVRSPKGLLRSAATTTISIARAQDKPILRVPAGFTAFDGRKNLFSWSEINEPFGNVNSSILTVTLKVANGRIDAIDASGVKVGGSETGRTFTGYATALNAYFQSSGQIWFTPGDDHKPFKNLSISISHDTHTHSTEIWRATYCAFLSYPS
jgi:hypothetical protein